MNKQTFSNNIGRSVRGFTLLELLITISVIAILSGVVSFTVVTIQKSSRDSVRDAKVRILSDALEKYYRTNGEYPSVAAMTSTNLDTLKIKLKLADTDLFKLPGSASTTSLAATGPSPTALVYAANTTDNTKNAQCQTDIDGYCDGFSLQYVKESGGIATYQSLHKTFVAVKDGVSCNAGDAQNGTTCTHTYTASYQNPNYSCSSGALSDTSCVSTYAANYLPGGGYYYCSSGATLNGATCTTTSTYAATYTPPPSGIAIGGDLPATTAVYGTGTYKCTNSNSSLCWQATITANGVTTTYKCTSSSSSVCWDGTYTVSNAPTGEYTCPSGGTLSGTTCTVTSTYSANYDSYPASYSCNSGDTLNGTTCTKTTAATVTPGYYYCPNGGTVSGTNCSYTYQLHG